MKKVAQSIYLCLTSTLSRFSSVGFSINVFLGDSIDGPPTGKVPLTDAIISTLAKHTMSTSKLSASANSASANSANSASASAAKIPLGFSFFDDATGPIREEHSGKEPIRDEHSGKGGPIRDEGRIEVSVLFAKREIAVDPEYRDFYPPRYRIPSSWTGRPLTLPPFHTERLDVEAFQEDGGGGGDGGLGGEGGGKLEASLSESCEDDSDDITIAGV